MQGLRLARPEGCQFMGRTAASSQVVGEALGDGALPHAALNPSGAPIWRDLARRSALALMECEKRQLTLARILTEDAVHNAMVLHAAFGGSTNLVLHLPAIAHAAGLPRPTAKDWAAVNRRVPRLVDVLPNGPVNFATVQVFLAGGVPRGDAAPSVAHGLLKLDARTVSGSNPWAKISPGGKSRTDAGACAEKLRELDGI